MESGLIIYPSWDHGDLETRDSSWHQCHGTWQSHSWSSYEPQSSTWQGNVPEHRGEHDKFEDCGYNCMLFQKGSRRADFRYLVATLVDKLQGRARLWVKKEELSNYEHDKWYGNSSWFTSRRKLEFGHISKRVPR